MICFLKCAYRIFTYNAVTENCQTQNIYPYMESGVMTYHNQVSVPLLSNNTGVWFRLATECFTIWTYKTLREERHSFKTVNIYHINDMDTNIQGQSMWSERGPVSNSGTGAHRLAKVGDLLQLVHFLNMWINWNWGKQFPDVGVRRAKY